MLLSTYWCQEGSLAAGEGKMLKLYTKFSSLFGSDRGASAVEYALLVGLIAIAVIAGVILLGQNLGHTFNKVATTLPTP
jgi:Flp pilus assembly pilin Flp